MHAEDLDFHRVTTNDDAVEYLRETLPQAYSSMSKHVLDAVKSCGKILSEQQVDFAQRLELAVCDLDDGSSSAIDASFVVEENPDCDIVKLCQTAYSEFDEKRSKMIDEILGVVKTLKFNAKSINDAVFYLETDALYEIKLTRV